MKFSELSKKARAEVGDIHVVSLTAGEIHSLIHHLRFPSFLGSFFKPDAYVEPGAGLKITKVELTNDGVEFTMLRVRIL